MVELVTCYRPDQCCDGCGAPGARYLIIRDERPTAYLCMDCARAGSGPAAMRARKRAKAMATAATMAALVSVLVEDVAPDDWPGPAWGETQQGPLQDCPTTAQRNY